ncbi:hypothetical protein D3C75_760640 [compost metagenome]
MGCAPDRLEECPERDGLLPRRRPVDPARVSGGRAGYGTGVGAGVVRQPAHPETGSRQSQEQAQVQRNLLQEPRHQLSVGGPPLPVRCPGCLVCGGAACLPRIQLWLGSLVCGGLPGALDYCLWRGADPGAPLYRQAGGAGTRWQGCDALGTATRTDTGPDCPGAACRSASGHQPGRWLDGVRRPVCHQLLPAQLPHRQLRRL